jgi:Transcriptional regulators
MVSITDVAKKAGCSATLVSRVVNNQYGVSDKSRKKIKEAIEELGYTPNGLARSLVLKKTNTIGVVIDTLCDAYFFDLIKGIESEVDKHGYDVLFCSGGNSTEKKNSYINFFMQERVDGIVIYGSNLDDIKFIEKLVTSKFPTALIENDVGQLNANNILLNNQYGSKLAVDYLFKCGCKSIYHVSGDADRQASMRRLDGYIEAMKSHGVTPDETMILESGWTEEQGYQSIKKFLLEYGKNKLPDAFYFGSDQTAFGGMKALIECGISIPDDVMLVGYDDDNPRKNDFQYIPLTTIHQPLDEMGKAAIRILINDIDEKKAVKEKIMFYPNLIIRNTTKEENSK